ncbi:MAG TPA: isoprenylcysteine carboxylmethyltransferase family protein [Gemmatimonadaceae bacterium]|nr:isoprenylcysteine carboxylmethyltransferase family protein [Gemmatimonadaceae bacterium]
MSQITDPNQPSVAGAETTARISAAEQSPAARIGAILFRHRGWLPLIFLGIPLVARGSTSPFRWQIGLALVVIGEAVRLAGVAAAGSVTRRRSRNVQRLVTYGIFAWCRNPLYVGNFLIWMGFVTISGVLWFLPIAIVLFAAEYELIVRYEEGVLESTFGREYIEYKNETPRWLPRPPKEPVSRGEHDWGEAWKSEISTFLQYAVLILAFYIKSRLTVSGTPGT